MNRNIVNSFKHSLLLHEINTGKHVVNLSLVTQDQVIAQGPPNVVPVHHLLECDYCVTHYGDASFDVCTVDSNMVLTPVDANTHDNASLTKAIATAHLIALYDDSNNILTEYYSRHESKYRQKF